MKHNKQEIYLIENTFRNNCNQTLEDLYTIIKRIFAEFPVFSDLFGDFDQNFKF